MTIDFENQIPQDQITPKENLILKEQFETEIEEYRSLIEQLQQVEGLNIENVSPRVSLTFLVEEIKKKNPETWREELKEFKEKIRILNETEGETGVSWFISEIVDTTYIEFLNKKGDEVQDENLKRKLEIIKKIAQQSLEFNRKTHELGQPVAFGGVSLDYAPKWYSNIRA